MMLSTINLTVILETLILGIVASSIVAIAVELWKKRDTVPKSVSEVR